MQELWLAFQASTKPYLKKGGNCALYAHIHWYNGKAGQILSSLARFALGQIRRPFCRYFWCFILPFPILFPKHFLQLDWREGKLSASLLHAHDTETRATMTMALAGNFIAAGQDATCHILSFQLFKSGQKTGGSSGDSAKAGENLTFI